MTLKGYTKYSSLRLALKAFVAHSWFFFAECMRALGCGVTSAGESSLPTSAERNVLSENRESLTTRGAPKSFSRTSNPNWEGPTVTAAAISSLCRVVQYSSAPLPPARPLGAGVCPLLCLHNNCASIESSSSEKRSSPGLTLVRHKNKRILR